MYDHLTAISAAMNTLGWSNYANDHEDGNGQFEQNFQFADALTTADRVVTLRYLLSMIAAERGMVATFMPKPFAEKTGSGLHLHLSLTSGGTPVFPADDDSRGLGLSETAYAFIGGILEACQCAAGRGGANGQLLQANRRDDDGVRRVVGAEDPDLRRQRPHSLHPRARLGAHRACAAATAPPTRTWRSPRHWVPASMGSSAAPTPEALAARDVRRCRRRCCTRSTSSEGDPVVAGVLDAAGDGVAGYFANVKREEFFAYHSAVTPWEIDHYLTAF